MTLDNLKELTARSMTSTHKVSKSCTITFSLQKDKVIECTKNPNANELTDLQQAGVFITSIVLFYKSRILSQFALFHKYCMKIYEFYFVMALFVTPVHWLDNKVISSPINLL